METYEIDWLQADQSAGFFFCHFCVLFTLTWTGVLFGITGWCITKYPYVYKYIIVEKKSQDSHNKITILVLSNNNQNHIIDIIQQSWKIK